MNGLLLILKAIKWFWMLSSEEKILSQSEPLLYFIGTSVTALVTINVIDVMTALAEVSVKEGVMREFTDPNNDDRSSAG